MKALNDEMDARFEGKGCRLLPAWWINSDAGRTELSWWELDDSSQMNFIVERLVVVEKSKGAAPVPRKEDKLPEGFWFYLPELTAEVLGSLSDAGTFISFILFLVLSFAYFLFFLLLFRILLLLLLLLLLL